MRRVLAAAGLAVALAAAGCASSGSTGSGTAPGNAAPAQAPAAASWKPGGSYTGPVPPPSLPSPVNRWALKPYTGPNGYKVQDSIVFGVPLHYAIPQDLINCDTAYPGQRQDLPPGQYVVPFEVTVTNQTGQQAPAIVAGLWAGDASGNATLDVTNGMQNGNDTNGLWADGSCTLNNGQNLNAGGSTALFGFIGPATPAQLADTVMYTDWANDNTAPRLSLPLPQLLPDAGASWLVTETGTALPSAAASPSVMPQSCPSPPSSYDKVQQETFNTACGDWVNKVSDQLGSDGQGTPPAKAEADWCAISDESSSTASDPGTTNPYFGHPEKLLPACLAGVRAADAP